MNRPVVNLYAIERQRKIDLAMTMDQLHVSTAIPALDMSYHMLLEKPMSTTLDECVAIDDARHWNGRIVLVSHSLRYHWVCVEVKRLFEAGAIGRLISVVLLRGLGSGRDVGLLLLALGDDVGVALRCVVLRR